AGTDRSGATRLSTARPESGPCRRQVGRIIGWPCDSARRRAGVTRATVDDGCGRDIVSAVHTVGAGWQIAMGFFHTAVISACQVDVTLGYIVKSTSAARAAVTAGVAGAADKGSASRAVFVLRDLIVDGIRIAPTLARLLIHERLNRRHGGRGNRSSAKTCPGTRGAGAGR